MNTQTAYSNKTESPLERSKRLSEADIFTKKKKKAPEPKLIRVFVDLPKGHRVGSRVIVSEPISIFKNGCSKRCYQLQCDCGHMSRAFAYRIKNKELGGCKNCGSIRDGDINFMLGVDGKPIKWMELMIRIKKVTGLANERIAQSMGKPINKSIIDYYLNVSEIRSNRRPSPTRAKVIIKFAKKVLCDDDLKFFKLMSE